MQYNNSSKAESLALTGLFAAMTCIATMLIKIPTLTGGYFHFGDTFVILSGIFPGGLYGILAAAIGSSLADLFSGYIIYAPATFFIKLLAALVVSLIYHKCREKIHKNMARLILSGILASLVVAGGYFLYEIFFYGLGALVEVIPNLCQTGLGLAIAGLLYQAFARIPQLKKYI